MKFDDYKNLVFVESSRLKLKEPAVLLKKSEILQKEGEDTIKRYPKFLTIRNMVSAIIRDKWLVPCPICGELENYDQCIRRTPKPTCGKESCRQEAIKRTSLKKYGASMFMNSEKFIEQKRANGWKPWNSYCKREENTKFINNYYKVKQRLKDNHLSGIETIEEYKGIVNPETKKHYVYTFTCDVCGLKFDGTLHSRDFPFCRNCHPKQYRNVKFIKDENEVTKFVRSSVEEREIGEFCEKLGFDTVYNHKGLIGDTNKEVDIFIPNVNVAIEYNGLYWHSSKFNKRFEHRDKTNECIKNDVKLIQVFEDEWKYKKRIVMNRLRSILGKSQGKIYARKCIVKEIDVENAKKFLNKYHLQGYVQANVKLGLFYKNRLVAVMTFGKPRFNKNYEWELLRFATIGNFSINGGCGKLFKFFTNNYDGSIISYSDRRWGTGEVYQKVGFEKIGVSEPNYFYINHDKRFSRYLFQKHKLKDKLSIFDENLSEVENMKNNGFYQIWDCGNDVFSYQPMKNRGFDIAP